MRGEKITDEAKNLIIDTREKLKSYYGKDPSVKQVLEAAKKRTETKKFRGIVLPELRKAQDIIRPVRERDIELNKDIQSKPWSLLSLDEFQLSPESIPSVLQVWRYAANTYKKFTIRQAKWVSRLYLIITDITELWYHSYFYAHYYEELNILPGKPANDFKTLYYLSMTPLEQKMPYLPHRLYMANWESYSKLDIPYSDDGGIIEELDVLPVFPETDKDFKIIEYLEEIQSTTTYFKDFNIRMLYLRHFYNLAKGPKWADLDGDDIIKIISTLRTWVKEIENSRDKIYDNDFYVNPDELYTMVGYDLDTLYPPSYIFNPGEYYKESK